MGITARMGGHQGVLVPNANRKSLALERKRQPFPGSLVFQLDSVNCGCLDRRTGNSYRLTVSPKLPSGCFPMLYLVSRHMGPVMGRQGE